MKYTHVVYRCICMRKHSIRCCEVELCQQDKDLWRYHLTIFYVVKSESHVCFDLF